MKRMKIYRGHRYFEAQEKGEEALLIVRMHWLLLAAPFFYGLFTMLILLTLSYLVFTSNTGISELVASLGQPALVATIVFFTQLYVFSAWLSRYFNVLILTNKHIVDITQHALFSRKVSTLSLESIEDVVITKKGLLANILDYGNLLVQTAGELPNFQIDNIGDPESVQKAIMEAKQKYALRHSPNHPNP